MGETLGEEEPAVPTNIIIPPSPWLISDTDIPFIGPLYLSAYLKEHGHDVTVTDLSGKDLNDWIPGKYDIYGITGTSANFPQMKIIAQRIRDLYPTSYIVAGGAHATLAPDHLLSNSEVDICIKGPGEIAFERFLANGNLDYEFDYEDYLMSPIPDYEAIDFSKYLPSQTYKYLLGIVNEATIFTTLGCPYKCNFCAQHKMRNKIKFIPLNDVEKNLLYLKEKYGVKLFYISDDTFGFAKSRFGDLCNMFKKHKITWHCLLRADLAQESRLKFMNKSGCIGVVYGFESGSNKILKLMNKGVTANQNYEAAKITQELGMTVRGQMVVGFPGETDKTIKETKRFIGAFPNVIWGVHTFQPYPGSDVWNFPEKYGIKIDKETDFSDWHTIGKPGEIKGSEKIQKWIKELKDIAGNKSIERACE